MCWSRYVAIGMREHVCEACVTMLCNGDVEQCFKE